MPRVQRQQAWKGIPVSVVIRKQGFGTYAWTCTVPVKKDGVLKPCGHLGIAGSEAEAKSDYASHKKVRKDH